VDGRAHSPTHHSPTHSSAEEESYRLPCQLAHRVGGCFERERHVNRILV